MSPITGKNASDLNYIDQTYDAPSLTKMPFDSKRCF